MNEPLRGTLLVVEDDPAIRRGLEINLQAEGYEVTACGDGAAAAELLQRQQFDLLIFDIMLPGQSGLRVVRELRARAVRTPVIFVSARDAEDDIVHGLQVGADDYIVKPFRLRELLARIQTQLRRHPPRHHYRFGDVEIDVVQHTVTRGGVLVELDTKAFDLLVLMLRHQGEVLSREQILDAVWGDDYIGTDRTVDNVITRLRQHLDTPGTPKFILTVRGKGYRLSTEEGRP